MINYLFDVDGTLTPSRGAMDSDFQKLFIRFFSRESKAGNKVFFVTGSDKDKTIEQVGGQLWRAVHGSYQNSGNQLYSQGTLVKQSEWMMGANLHLDLLNILETSKWYGRAETNIEERVGMVNISTVGRSADNVLRKEYYNWDNQNREREKIVSHLSLRYPDLEFAIGGEISIDIYPKGKDKSQVLEDMQGKTIFFGDRCEQGGNDHTIAMKSDKYFNVTGWQDCMRFISGKPV